MELLPCASASSLCSSCPFSIVLRNRLLILRGPDFLSIIIWRTWFSYAYVCMFLFLFYSSSKGSVVRVCSHLSFRIISLQRTRWFYLAARLFVFSIIRSEGSVILPLQQGIFSCLFFSFFFFVHRTRSYLYVCIPSSHFLI